MKNGLSKKKCLTLVLKNHEEQNKKDWIEKIMGKLIKFPAHRVVYNSEPTRPELSEDEARQIKEEKFVEQITENLILDIRLKILKILIVLN